MKELEFNFNKAVENHNYKVENIFGCRPISEAQRMKAIKIAAEQIEDLIHAARIKKEINMFRMEHCDGRLDLYEDDERISLGYYKNKEDVEIWVKIATKNSCIIHLRDMTDEEKLEHKMLKESHLI